MAVKPPGCKGCPLYEKGEGFALPSGPHDALICFVGEALGREEVDASTPFVGAAGRKLNASIQRLGMNRDQVRVGNVISCRPPDNMLVGASYEQGAIAHCRVHRRKLEGSKVYVTLGVTATRTMLKEIHGIEYSGRLEDWHGYVLTGDSQTTQEDDYLYLKIASGVKVIPTYHPSHLIQGQQKLTGVFLHDIKRAMEVASFGFTRGPVSLITDPPPAWFDEWVDQVTPDCWMAVDIETSMKVGTQEDDLEVPVGEIVRVNFSVNPGEGVTVPWDGRYLGGINKALALPCVKVFWNANFDVPILRDRAGIEVAGPHYDGMWAWHMLQSDVPKGLGFVAPFYSDLPPWKHLSGEQPAYYGAMDGVQQLRLMFGIARDLQKSGQWESYLRYAVKFDQLVLRKMEIVGLMVDSQRLLEFQSRLKQYEALAFDKLQEMIPEEVKPLVPAGGWKRFPSAYPKELVVTREVEVPALLCTDCGEEGVPSTHNCRAEAEGAQ